MRSVVARPPATESPLLVTRVPGAGGRSSSLIALAVAVVAAAVASVRLTRRQLWYDEYATWFVTTLSWSDFRRLLGNIDIVHGLYYLVMRQWTALSGDSPLALRAPSIVGVAVAAGAVVLLGRRLCGTLTGLAAGLVYAAIPAVSRFGQEARSYAWVTALAVLCTIAFLRALERPRWPRWLLYGGCLLVLVHLHVVAALLLPTHALLAVGLARRGSPPRTLWRWALVAAVTAVLTAPMLYEASGQTGQVAWIPGDAHAVRQYLPNLFGSPGVAWVLVPLGLLGAAVLWYTNRALLPALLGWAVLPPVVCYVSYPVVHLFLAKYVLFTLPAWALLAAISVTVPLAGLRRWMLPFDVGVLLAVVLAGVAVVGLDAQAEIRGPRVIGQPDFRSAAEVIDARFRPGDGVAYAGFNTLGQPRQPLEYELKRSQPRDVFAAGRPGSHGRYGAPECADPAPCLGDTPRIWLLANSRLRQPLASMPPAQEALLRQNYTVLSTDSFAWVDVLLLVHR